MYRKVKISERLPEEGKPVITIDSKGNAIVYKRTGIGWNMPVLENNHPMEYWLEEVDYLEIETKAKNWDSLDKKIAACYFDDEGNELSDEQIEHIDLTSIGEIAATELGYLQ